MPSSNRHALTAFLLGVFSVPIAGSLAAVVRSAGFGSALWPWDIAVVIGLAGLGTSLRFPDAPMAFMVGVCSVFLSIGLFGNSAAGFVTMLLMAIPAVACSLAAELLAFIIRVVARHVRPSRP